MFKEAIIDAFKWSTKWYLGSFSTAVATFFFFEKYLEFSRVRSIRYGIALLIISFLIKAIIQYIKKIDQLKVVLIAKDEQIELLNSKKEKKKLLQANNFYGEAIIILKDAFSKFHFLRKKDKIEQKELITTLVFLCNSLKELFEKRFSYTYSVSIKVLVPEVDLENITTYTQVTTLCRDLQSYTRRSQPNHIKHNIFENTCYVEIFLNIGSVAKSHYLNNDLPEDRYYKNTSFNIYGFLPESDLTTEERRKAWTLPYRSELVVPITPIETEGNRVKQFLGYLCVDCNEEDAFHSKYDTNMLKGVADGIYDIIQQKYNLN